MEAASYGEASAASSASSVQVQPFTSTSARSETHAARDHRIYVTVYFRVDCQPMSTTIRVPNRTRDRLAALASAMGRPMTAVVDDALDALERRVFFEGLNARYAELRADEASWTEIEAERAIEEGALRDRSA